MALDVLIVDDSKAMRAVIKKTLMAAGFKVEHCYEAANGREALELMESHSVNVVLSDLHMPQMDGMEFLRKLQESQRLPDCFILVTTEGRRERLKEALGLGANGYVTKPFQPEGLRKILSLFVGEPDADDRMEASLEGSDF